MSTTPCKIHTIFVREQYMHTTQKKVQEDRFRPTNLHIYAKKETSTSRPHISSSWLISVRSPVVLNQTELRKWSPLIQKILNRTKISTFSKDVLTVISVRSPELVCGCMKEQKIIWDVPTKKAKFLGHYKSKRKWPTCFSLHSSLSAFLFWNISWDGIAKQPDYPKRISCYCPFECINWPSQC